MRSILPLPGDPHYHKYAEDAEEVKWPTVSFAEEAAKDVAKSRKKKKGKRSY